MSAERPKGVPDDWECKPCESCGRATWYPPAAEQEAAAHGLAFMVVCQQLACIKAAPDMMREKLKAARIERATEKFPHVNTTTDPLWDQAALNPGTVVDIGRLVACDDCGTDYTDSALSGGFVWLDRATCPRCADRVLKVLPTQKLVRLTRDAHMCPSDKSFADFVRSIRTHSRVTVTKRDSE